MNVSLKIQRNRKIRLTEKEKKIVASIVRLGFTTILTSPETQTNEISFIFTDEKYKPESKIDKGVSYVG